MTAITKTAIATGFSIQFPFELKDGFRKAFPSATWNATGRRWEVGPRSGTQLDAWIATVSEAAERITTERADADAVELAESELSAIRAEAERIARDLEAARATRRTVEAVRAEIAAHKTEIAEIAVQVEAERAATATAKADIRTEIGKIIDVNGMRSALDKLIRANRGGRSAASRREFEGAQKALDGYDDELIAAGWKSPELRRMINANYNRPDRDKTDATLDGLLRVQRIEA